MPTSPITPARELANIKYALDKSAIVAITDHAGRIVHVNDKFCEISKYSREELLGKTHRIINSGYHSREFFEDMWKTIAGGGIWEGEIRNRAKDGSQYWVNTCIVPFLDDHGRPYEYVAIRYEITQRKLAEEQLKTYATRLETSNQELQHFASVAAHDLQEPLRKVLAFSDRLLTKYRSAVPEEGQMYLDRIQNSARRMQTLIDDLLSFSRVTTRGQAFVDVDLTQIVRDVLGDLEIRIEETKAKIECASLPHLVADPLQMRQLFQNLIGNALKFHRLGVPPVIRISSETRGETYVITVEDNGIGFDEKYLDRIFAIFQRLHGRNDYEGNGVGLAVCRRIVERHGGFITAKSTPGQGAQFIVSLPTEIRTFEVKK
ncbi:MAG: ATP-binding protein [Bdellovibrionaceae bacterium]|nr:ATP-binding protein [Pseudobdellovibrionaceae bacterium]